MMNKINQLKTVAFLKLAESRVISHENLFRVCPKDMEKFDQFWGAFERNLDVYIKNMIAADGALVVISKKIADARLFNENFGPTSLYSTLTFNNVYPRALSL